MKRFLGYIAAVAGILLLAGAAARLFATAEPRPWWAWALAGVLASSSAVLPQIRRRAGIRTAWLAATGLLAVAVQLCGGFQGPLAPAYFLFLMWLASPSNGAPAAEAGLMLGAVEALSCAAVSGWSLDAVLSNAWTSLAAMLSLPLFGVAAEWIFERACRPPRADAHRREAPQAADAGIVDWTSFQSLVEGCASSGSVARAVHSVLGWLAGSDRGITATIALADDSGEDLEVYESIGPFSQGRTGRCYPRGEGVAGWVATCGRRVRRSGLRGGDRPVSTLSPADESGLGASSCAAVPVFSAGRTVGVILLESAEDEAFDQVSEAMLVSAASTLGLTLEKLLLEEQKRSLSGRDGLTGLPLLSDLMEHLRVAARDVQRFGKSVAVIVAGLDSLQRINEELGFRTGDLALRRCASRLRTLVGEEVLVARLGGDRFAVCLTGADRAAAEAIAECITRSFAQTPVNLSEREELLVVSVGGCTTRAERRVDCLPSEAARALEQARQSRPGSFRIVEISALGTSNGR